MSVTSKLFLTGAIGQLGGHVIDAGMRDPAKDEEAANALCKKGA